MLLYQDHKMVVQMEICFSILESEDFVNSDSISTFIPIVLRQFTYLHRTCLNIHILIIDTQSIRFLFHKKTNTKTKVLSQLYGGRYSSVNTYVTALLELKFKRSRINSYSEGNATYLFGFQWIGIYSRILLIL